MMEIVVIGYIVDTKARIITILTFCEEGTDAL